MGPTFWSRSHFMTAVSGELSATVVRADILRFAVDALQARERQDDILRPDPVMHFDGQAFTGVFIEHHWFEDRVSACTPLVYIDDATSRLMQILLHGTESTFGYVEPTRRYIDQHGNPLAFYIDKASIFLMIKASLTAERESVDFFRSELGAPL